VQGKTARTAVLAALGLLAAAVPARAADARLERLAPVLVHHGGERFPATSVRGSGVPGTAGEAAGPVVYGRVAPGGWLQYWIWFADNPQDRGIFRSGRHAGDWEQVQYRLDGGEAVYAQHSGAERCGRASVEWRGGRPVVYVANGSHAAYFHAGVRDRMWPDPNDEADGRGVVQRPRVVEVDERAPAWMRFRGRWGGARAGWFPPEQPSPPGPAFQGERWDDPAGWARSARACTGRRCVRLGACDGAETALAGAIAAPLALLAAFALWRRRRRRSRSSKTRGDGAA
jgi:hypothetical protein